jgi:hypothetical protein
MKSHGISWLTQNSFYVLKNQVWFVNTLIIPHLVAAFNRPQPAKLTAMPFPAA